MSDKGTIYDLGSNNGDDLPYYLMKGLRVVAVEANPGLCDHIRQRFAEPLGTGQLVVVNAVLSNQHHADPVTFYLHKFNHVLSQFPPPLDDNPASETYRGNYHPIQLGAVTPADVVRAHGEPHYIKIDVETYDEAILANLFAAGIRPPYISAESHSIDVFASLVAVGGYRRFKLVDGGSVPDRYANHVVETPIGQMLHNFPYHSAGPYGEDIPGDWLGPNDFFYLLASQGLGWKDIHAKRDDV